MILYIMCDFRNGLDDVALLLHENPQNTANVLAHIGGIELLLFLVEKGLATQALRI